MSDIFISYARADRDRVQALASALEAEGYNIWWDRHMESGSQFSKEIEKQLADAKAAIVCWSEHSCESRWVRDEASFAADADKLLAVSLDGTMPPMGFRQYHSLDLSGWDGGREGLAELLATIRRKMGDHALSPEPQPAAAPDIAPKRKFGWLAALLLLLGVGGLIYYGVTREDENAQAAQAASIAVLPFEALSNDESDDYFGRGIAEELLNALTEFPDLKVAGRSSAFSFDEDALANEIGDQLGVEHVLRGTVRRAGERVRITAALTSASTGEQIWAETYERELTDIFAIQDEIVGELARVLQFRLGVGAGAGRADAKNVDPRAYEAYLKGLDLWSRRELLERRMAAIDHFRQATEFDPAFADGWSAYGMALSLTGTAYFQNSDPEQSVRKIRAALDRALELDPGNARANAVLAAWGVDPAGAQGFIDAALARAPNDAFVAYSAGLHAQFVGDMDEAIRQFDRSLALDPLNLTVWRIRTFAYSGAGRFDEVSEELMNAATCTDTCHFGQVIFAASGLLATVHDQSAEDIGRWLALLGENRQRVAGESGEDDLWLNWLSDYARSVTSDQSFTAQLPADPAAYRIGVGLATPATLLAHSGHFDEALILLENGRKEMELFGPNDFLPLLPGRLEYPEELRRDPRYHALWSHPQMKALAQARRANGQTAGLPLPIE
ncbi:TIR domain-containing protein [Sphingomicrobium flavum]|uniref:TIR domain-containing protein n=1 Tax=Sphingomicrobium flavum TaxID=1229164 RepID=UPI0021AE2A5A|nr:TIR domain-containing protein [Sphingomicrobium flavum]